MARYLNRIAAGAFASLIVLSPLRAGVTVVARPIGNLYSPYTDIQFYWSDIPTLVLVVAWAMHLRVTRGRPRLGPRVVAWPAIAVVVALWLGTPVAVDPLFSACTAGRITILALVALYVVNEVHTLAQLTRPLLLMVTTQSVVAIGQVIGQHSLGLSRLGEAALSPSMPVSVVTARDGTRVLRGYGLADHPNILGGVLAIAIVLLAGALAVRRPAPASAPRSVIAVACVALLMTFSRGAWAALVAGIAVVVAMAWINRRSEVTRSFGVTFIVAAVLVAPLATFFGGVLIARTTLQGPNPTETRSIDERIALSEATLQVIERHPISGVGAGGLPEALHDENPSFRFTFQPSAVVLLDVTAETGVLGGAAYLVLLLLPWCALVWLRRHWTVPLIVASGALAAITVAGFFDYYTWSYPAGRIWSWIVLGLWAMTFGEAVQDARALPDDMRRLRPLTGSTGGNHAA